MPEHQFPPRLGIGRLPEGDWMPEFLEAFRQELPNGAEFRRIATPSLLYASGEELRNRGLNGPAQVEALIGNMCINGVLAESATEEVRTTFKDSRSHFARHTTKNGGHRPLALKIRIVDVPSDDYRTGFLLTGERLGVRRNTGLQASRQPPSMQGGRALSLRLGTVKGARFKEIKQSVDAVAEDGILEDLIFSRVQPV